MRSSRRLLGVAIACVAALHGCATSFHDEYAARNPDFDPTLPRVGPSLPELLAALHAPGRVEKIQVSLARLVIYRVEGDTWREIPFEAIRTGEERPAAADYAVLVVWACRYDQGLEERGVRRAGFYLLPSNRVAVYDHYDFRERCAATNEFLAARGPHVAAEREAFARLAGLGNRFTLVQAYRRGLAYLEAGRLPEARAMLLLGEKSYRASAEALRASGRAEALAEAERMRAALMRALGVEVRAPDPPPR